MNLHLPHVSAAAILVGAALLSAMAAPCLAQKPTQGFDVTVDPNATGEELNSQSNLWALEVSFKTMRMIWVDITDPKTGKTSREQVWYLPYRAVNRPLERKADSSDLTPVNQEDPPPSGPLFVPEFELVTQDDGVQHVYPDVIIPEAQAAILEREQRNGSGPVFKNSVGVIQEIPPAVEAGNDDEQPIYGVAMWRAVDPETDFFTVFMSGFSNGYTQVTGPDGEPLTLRRTLVQEFWRPGDQFNPREVEIRRKGEPVWQYRPDAPHDVTKTSVSIVPGAEPAKPETGAESKENETP